MNETKLSLYADRMKEIVKRTNVIDAFLDRRISALYVPTTVESIYLQFRNILELIATASLIVNESARVALNEEGRRKWHAGDILDAVEEVNPSFFYPKPIRAKKSHLPEGQYNHRDFKGDYLTREQFSTLYDVCSRTIHTVNPLDPGQSHQKSRFSIGLCYIFCVFFDGAGALLFSPCPGTVPHASFC